MTGRWRGWISTDATGKCSSRWPLPDCNASTLLIPASSPERDHAANIAHAFIRPDRDCALGQSQPDRALRLQQASERAVVDNRAAYLLDAARGLERLSFDQHASASRRRGTRFWIVHPSKGIE